MLVAEEADFPGLGSPKHKSLVAALKQLQRESDEGRQMWWRWCEAVGSGGRDPKRHTVKFLEDFFEALQQGAIPDFAVQPEFVPPVVRVKSLSIQEEQYLEQLVQHVKASQRRSLEWKKRWWKYCDTHGGGMHDPRRHDTAFIEKFLRAQSSEGFITDSAGLRADAVQDSAPTPLSPPIHDASPPVDPQANGAGTPFLYGGLDAMTTWSL